LLYAAAILAATLAFAPARLAAETATVGGAKAQLSVPERPKASLILVPGRGGLSAVDPLQRAARDYAARGFAVLSVDSKTNIGAAFQYMQQVARPVWVAAVSAGTRRLGGAIASGKFLGKRIVLVSGNLKQVREQIGRPELLPRTLIIHHRYDRCQNTLPDEVAPFQAWGGNKVSVVWMDGGSNEGDPCGPRSHHGMAGLDGKVADAIAAFLE